MAIKAIETVYQGYKFRSRLEARWAVFFDTLGIEWEYEKEGYDLDGVWYLPDFWLPELDCWVEIKPEFPRGEEDEKAALLAWHSKKLVYICFADTSTPGIDDTCARGKLAADRMLSACEYGRFRLCSKKKGGTTVVFPYRHYPKIENLFKGSVRRLTEDWQNALNIEGDEDIYHMTPCHWWVECPVCHKVGISSVFGFVNDLPCKCIDRSMPPIPGHNSPRLITAYTAAHQARFEHKRKA